ncbi:MAG: hypothetical protein HYV59_12170 [Planctomycetes bacterium]|nr:hypothetical protein [Planctomycetota bacterium]
MKNKNVLIQIADILLVSEEATADWVSDKKLLHAWYFICMLALAGLITRLISPIFLELLRKSSQATFVHRGINLGFGLLLLGALMNMTFCYFNFIITKRIQIKLINIVYFYLISLLFWSYTYKCLYMLSPSSFEYTDPFIIPLQTTVSDWWSNFRTLLDFLLFSAFHSIGGGFYKIRLHSIVSSFVGWSQSLYSLSLVALLIASYVNQRTNVNDR